MRLRRKAEQEERRKKQRTNESKQLIAYIPARNKTKKQGPGNEFLHIGRVYINITHHHEQDNNNLAPSTQIQHRYLVIWSFKLCCDNGESNRTHQGRVIRDEIDVICPWTDE